MDSQKSWEKIQRANKIREDIIDGYRVMVILRGLPGSGKSTMAKDFCALTLNSEPKNFIFSTDDFFLNNHTGQYRFDPTQLQKAHLWNQKRVETKAKIGWSPIFIDNTNTQVWEMIPYIKVAVANGYTVQLLEPDTPWFKNPVLCANNNVHNVGFDTVLKMHQRYEQADIKSIFVSFKIKYSPYMKLPQDSCTKHLLKSDDKPFDGVTSESVTNNNSIIQHAENEETEEENAWGPLVSSQYITVQSVSTHENEFHRYSSADIFPVETRLREVTLNDNDVCKKYILPRLELVNNNSDKGYFLRTTWEAPQNLGSVCNGEPNYSDCVEPVLISWDEQSSSTIHKKQEPKGLQREQHQKPETVNLESSEDGRKQVQSIDKQLEPFVSDSNFHIILGIRCIEKLNSQFSVNTAISKQMVSVVTVPEIMALQLYSCLEASEFRQWQQEQQGISKDDEFLAYLLQKMGCDIDDLSTMDNARMNAVMNDYLSNQDKRSTVEENVRLTSDEKDDHFIDLDIGFECATQLKCLFGSDYDISYLYTPIIRLPYHLALQLHSYWEHSMHEQWRIEQYEIVKIDEQIARELQDEENRSNLGKRITAKKEEPFQKVKRPPKHYKGVNVNPNLPFDSQKLLLVAHMDHHNKGVDNMEKRIALYNDMGRRSSCYSAIRIREVVQECEILIQKEFSLSAKNFVDYTIKSGSPQQIDLHLFFLVEATFAVNMFLDQHIMMMRSNGQLDVTLEFITGQGLHSRHGKPKIRPAVQKILKQRHLTSQTVYNNNGVLTAKVFINSFLTDEIE